MAITDIISEEEISTPNMEVASVNPDDFMTEDEMDPMQDPELQQLLDSMPGEQAEVLMQLIKEFKAMVAQGFQGEFEDFVKMKMASAQGGPEEDFMTEEEMIIPDEELQSMVPMGEQAAQGGRIGRQTGGIMDVELVPAIKWLKDRNLPITPENIRKAMLEMSREVIPQALIGQNISETVTPDVAQLSIGDEEVVPQAKPEDDVFSDQEMIDMKQDYIDQGGTLDKASWGIEDDVEDVGIMQTTDPIFYSDDKITYTDDDKKEWFDQINRLKTYRKGLAPDSYLRLKDDKMKEGINKGFISEEDYLNKWQMPFFGQGGENVTKRIDDYRNWAFGDDNYAQGGRAGYQYGNQVTADAPGIMSQVSPSQTEQIQQSQAYEEAMQKIMNKFYEKFPGIDGSGMRIEDMVAELQAEGVGEHAPDILSFAAGLDMITPESVIRSTRAMDRHGRFDYPEEHQFDHPVDEMRGRPGYGLGSLVKSVFKGGKKLVKGLTKSIKKFAKSDLGKMALMYMATAGMANIGAGGWAGAQPWSKGAWLKPSNVLGLGKTGWGNIGKSFTNLGFGDPVKAASDKLISGNQYSPIANMGYNKNLSTLAKGKEIADKGGLFSKALGSFKDNPMPWILGTSGLAGLYTKKNPGDTDLDSVMANYKGEVADWDKMIADIRAGQGVTPFATDNVLFPYPNYYQLAGGGRVGAQEGGLMDLGGLEKDYRNEGGFVPIGGKEKADDVPARLSRNEFVFTADAVRNAGGGDVDKGAEVMENVMTNLEQGGSISEESQGLEGARDMFATSQRLEGVL